LKIHYKEDITKLPQNEIRSVSDGVIENIIVTQNGENAVHMNLCSDIHLNNVKVFNNYKQENYFGTEATIHINKSERIFFKDLVVEGKIKDTEAYNCINVEFE